MNDAGHDFLSETVVGFLERLAAKEPAPGGGSVAALLVAMAAGLVGMGARFSEKHWEESERVAREADGLRAAAAPLAQKDAEAFAEFLAASRIPKEEGERRERAMKEATDRAAGIPLEIARLGAAVAELAAALAANGNPTLRDDAVSAALFAEAATKATANLVRVNLGTDDDERVTQAGEHARTATSHAETAFAVGR